jgi:hypothetical protein
VDYFIECCFGVKEYDLAVSVIIYNLSVAFFHWQGCGLTIEHIINAGKDMEKLLLLITNEIFTQERVPETLKAGLLTPIFKYKGLKTQATNNGGIPVLQVISKIVETIIKARWV